MILQSSSLIKKIILVAMLILGALGVWLIQPPATSNAAAPTATPSPQAPATNRSAAAPNQTFSVFLPFTAKSAQPPAPAPTYKKGASLASGHQTDCASLAPLGVYWAFNWTPSSPNCAGIDSVPMFWNGNNVAGTTIGGNSEWILGFNEPDSASQANMTPQQAADAWYQIEQKYPNKKLAAPAPSGASPWNAPNNNWIGQFRNAYIATYRKPPRLDALTLHCYSWYANYSPSYGCIPYAQAFESWASVWGVSEVWVTEFSFATISPSSPSQSIIETKTFIDWMQTQPQIKRFALFTTLASSSDSFVPGGFLTPLVEPSTRLLTGYGNLYVGYK